jgi:hypothetical protein
MNLNYIQLEDSKKKYIISDETINDLLRFVVLKANVDEASSKINFIVKTCVIDLDHPDNKMMKLRSLAICESDSLKCTTLDVASCMKLYTNEEISAAGAVSVVIKRRERERERESEGKEQEQKQGEEDDVKLVFAKPRGVNHFRIMLSPIFKCNPDELSTTIVYFDNNNNNDYYYKVEVVKDYNIIFTGGRNDENKYKLTYNKFTSNMTLIKMINIHFLIYSTK